MNIDDEAGTSHDTTPFVPPTVIPVMQQQPEISGVSVGLRIPPIWRDKMRGWFAHFEAIMKSQKKGDQAMYELVLGQLERQDVDEIYDILLRPPEENKYLAIKQRLLQVYEDSELKNVQRVIAGMELGDLKPSQLLRRMQNLAGDHLSTVTLRGMWLNQLPDYISSIIAISEKTSLSEVALMADKMMDQHSQREISAIRQSPRQSISSQPEACAIDYQQASSSKYARSLEDKIDKLTEAIAQLVTSNNNQRGRSPYRNWNQRQNRQASRSNNRNQSAYRSRTPSNSPYCYYHRRFGPRAKKCAENCTFLKESTQEN